MRSELQVSGLAVLSGEGPCHIHFYSYIPKKFVLSTLWIALPLELDFYESWSPGS